MTSPKPRHLFAYGSLMAPSVYLKVVGRDPKGASPKMEPAVLKGFRRRAVLNAWYPGIVPASGEQVQGMLIEVETPEDLARLDEYEGDDEYARIPVQVETNDGGGGTVEVEAEVYVFLRAERLSERDWVFEEFVASRADERM
ncbi:AIG2-like family-domain-containing protein [Zopfochytrium polystomum]|nr:AIG2-like family-domain-containing protein [Zopfochytrium polystomum]KAI9331999.1 AIG2-like family-domain-containing protein [Zopfochytrium polystomum]